MNSFDFSIITFVNQYVNKYPFFDFFMHGFANFSLLKGVPLIALLYWCWFEWEKNPATVQHKREKLLVALVGATVSPLIARVIANIVPFRERPLREPELHFVMPDFMHTENTIHWSSFPSDHVALLFPLVVGLMIVSRRVGAVALVLALIASFARVYAGLHHPTDVLASMVLGVAVFYAIDLTPLRSVIIRPAFYLMEKKTALFYAGFFLLTDQIANMFWETYTFIYHFFATH